MDDAGLLWGKAGHYSELQLVSTQCTHLTELLRMQLIREQIRHVTRLQTAVLAELEQDEDVLPITVWKKAVSCYTVKINRCLQCCLHFLHLLPPCFMLTVFQRASSCHETENW